MRMCAALAGLIVLAASVSLGDTNEALAQATPPTRVFGTVTVDGQTPPEGTTVEAFIGTRRCGTGEVRALGDPIGVGFLVDVDSETFSAGCGNDGETITFVVGGVPALETATFQTGAFVRQDLTATGQPATPAPSPTSTPSPSPGTPSPTPIGTASPTTGPSPTATVTPEASPTGTATGTPSATPEPTASPTATPTPIATTVRPEEEDGANDGGGVSPVVWTLLAVVVLAAGGLGVFLYQRSRGPTPP